jgi:hypothetical protein
MRKAFLSLLAVSFLIFMAGCETVKNTALGIGGATYLVTKGVADDTYNTYRTLRKADRWFQERWW